MKKAIKTFCKVLSVFLAVLFVIEILPLQVMAEEFTEAVAQKEFIEDLVNNPTDAENADSAEILYEVEEKRDEFTKVYKKTDGSYTAIVSKEPLHYLDNGVWEEIDNSLSSDGNTFTNASNIFNAIFPKSLDDNAQISIENGESEIAFSVNNISESTGVVENAIGKSDTQIDTVDNAIANTQSSITYEDVETNTDIQYIVTPNSIKENVIVSDKNSIKDSYSFTIEKGNLTCVLADDGSISFINSENEVEFSIPRPVMTDATLAFSYDIDVNVVDNNDGTIELIYSPSKEWTSSNDRVYPINIDPAIVVVSKYADWIKDNCVIDDSTNETDQDKNFINDYIGFVANVKETNSDGTTNTLNAEIYTKINPESFKNLGENIVFTDVQYILAGNGYGGKIIAKEVVESYNMETITHNDKPDHGDEVYDYYTTLYKDEADADANSEGFVFVHFNITKAFNEWLNGETNNGFVMVPEKEGTAGMFITDGVYSYTNPSTGSTTTTKYETNLIIDYVDVNGYNELYNYHSQNVGRAGTGYVNDFTQGLSVVRNGISLDGNIMPVSIAMNFGTAVSNMFEYEYSVQNPYGNGWSPNYQRMYKTNDYQIIYYTETGSEITFNIVENDDGTTSFVESTTDFVGESGYTIEKVSEIDEKNGKVTEYYQFVRPDGYAERFNDDGFLVSVSNPDYPEQQITIKYANTGFIECVTDGVGRKFVFDYDSNGMLSEIYCLSSTDTVITAGSTTSPLKVNYSYDENKNLTSVIFPDGKSINYTYDSNGHLVSMENIDGYRVVYTYDENGKVTSVKEQAKSGTEYVNGNSLAYVRLSPTQVKFLDGSGNYEIYQFNSNGTLLYTTDSNGNYAINNSQGSNNNSFFVLDNEYHTNSQNLLLNASFEEENSALNSSRAKYWENSNSSFERTTSNEPHHGDYVYTISSENNITDYQKQTVEVLSGGEYTFSAYIKSDETNLGELYLKMTSIDASNTEIITESISVESTGGVWQRYWVALDAPSNTKKIAVEFGLKDSHGIYYIDNVQLEQSSSVNNYNYIENGGFRENIEGWETELNYSIVDTEINDSIEKAVMLDRNIGVKNETEQDETEQDETEQNEAYQNAIYQNVRIDGRAGDVFTIGGWFKGLFVNSSTSNPIIHNLINDPNNNDYIFNFTNDRYAQIEMAYQYTEITGEGTEEKIETHEEEIVVPFAENIGDWQFAAQDFVLKGDCETVTVLIRYSNNANSALFSNIELSKNMYAITESVDDSTSEGEQGCNCTICENPDCPCECTTENLCFCVTCLQKNSTVIDDFGNITAVNSFDGVKTIQTLTRFTGDGNYIFSKTFSDGTTLAYDYNSLNGLLDAIEDGKGIKTSYEYDATSALVGVSTEDSSAKYGYTNDKLTSVTHNSFSYYLKYDCWGQLIEIAVGKETAIPGEVKTQTIISYEYGEGQFRERIKCTKYCNNALNPTITDYIYDNAGNIVEIRVNEEPQFIITYTTLGSVAEITKIDGRTVRYTDYRTEVIDSNGNTVYTTYIDELGNTVETITDGTETVNDSTDETEVIEYTTKSQGISFDSSTGNVTERKDITAKSGQTIGSIGVQDCFGRYVRSIAQTESTKDMNEKENYHNYDNPFAAVTSIYDYPTFDDNTTQNQVVGYKNYITYVNQSKEDLDLYKNLNPNYEYSYEYDANGNITTIKGTTPNSIVNVKYEYDNLNQLITEIDYAKKIKYVYCYDNAGNITSKEKYKLDDGNIAIEETKEVVNFYYKDENWKDKLTLYNGQTIEYDGVGNTTKLNGATLTWTGTQLDSYTYTETDENNNHITKQIRYSYDASGLMYRKTVHVKPADSSDESYQLLEQYDYTWTNGKLTSQIYTRIDNGTSTTYVMKFIYDVLNAPYGFILNGPNNTEKVYLFVKNLQGDILGIVDELGEIVLTYEYTVWGVPTYSVEKNDETLIHLIKALPLTYRGYCYDYDSGLYYMEDRYYNPEICRFINADSINSLLSTNTVLSFNHYAYCENNPVTHTVQNKNASLYSIVDSNYSYNKSISNKITSYIYDQNDDMVTSLRFGKTTFGPNGCGVVATYNALIMLGNRLDLSDIVREYEINGVSIYGIITFYPAFIARFFKARGYEVTVTYNVEKFDDNAEDAIANIVYYTRSRTGHYVALNYEDSHYWGYNTFGEDYGAYCLGTSIIDFLRNKGYTGRVLISISKS